MSFQRTDLLCYATLPDGYGFADSIAAASRAGFTELSLWLMTLDAAQMESIQLHSPAIRHTLLMLLADQDGAKLKTAEGKEELRQEAIETTRNLMQELTGENSVDELFFTAFLDRKVIEGHAVEFRMLLQTAVIGHDAGDVDR